MTDSMISLHMNLIYRICIYLPSYFMIYPARIKDPNIPQICSHMTSLLPLKKYVSTFTTPSDLTDILPSDDPNTIHIMKKYVNLFGRVHRGYCCMKHDKKDATKRQGSIAPHALIITRNFIIVMGFPGLVQRQGLASWNINILCHNFSVGCWFCLPSVLYFTCWTCFVIFFFLFHLSLPVIYHMYTLIGYLILYCFCWPFKCMLWQPAHKDKLYWPSSFL